MTRPNVPRVRLKTDNVAAFAVTIGPIFYFLPALLNHLKLGPYDGMLFNVPLRVATAQIIWSGHVPLWNPYIFGGMPLLASAQGGLLFPPNWFYLIFSPAVATNLMVISVYMIAALGAYLFARRTGASIAGAAVTSIVWQSGGFLLAQISHINIVHTAAILPWVLWSLERYVASGSRVRGALLALFIAIQIFAGHQQTFAYAFLLVCAYAIVMAFGNTTQRKHYLGSLAYVGAGVLLGAVQILPTVELLRNSVRATATYEFFSSFSMPGSFFVTLLAPYVLGGGDSRLFRAPYIGQLFYTEYVAYAGVLAVMLSVVALLLKPDKRTKFWVAAAVIGFILALGSNAPLYLYRLIYFVPVMNLFRVPARHLLEFNFAIAVLAGRGLTSLEAMRNDKRTTRFVLILSGVVFLLTILIVTLGRPSNFQLARAVPVTLLRAPELFVPIVVAGVSGFAIWFFARGRRGALALLMTVLVADLWLWGQFCGWYTASGGIPKEFWTAPESVQLLREKASAPTSYRILTTHQVFHPGTPVSNAPPNGWTLWTEPDVYMMYGIQNTAGYDGFGLERYSELAGRMKLWGELTDANATLRGNSRELDILNTRYLISRREQANDFPTDNGVAESSVADSTFSPATEKYGDYLFGANDLTLPNITTGKRLTIKVPLTDADHVALITNLTFAEDIPDNTVVAHLHLRAKGGKDFDLPLRAGVETADWAFDRPDIRARIKHKRAVVATSYDVSDAQHKYKGHTYVASFVLPEKVTIESGYVELDTQLKASGFSLRVFRVSLVDGEKSYPLSQKMIEVGSDSAQSAETDERWTLVAEGEKVRIFENARALPRTWLASEARVLDENAMLSVIRSGVFPDGSKWDPLHTVLVSSSPATPLTNAQQNSQQQGKVEITKYEPNRVELSSQAPENSILVLSENDYPGWRAYIDGQSVEVLRVNYALRGVLVPAGTHQIGFVYRPWSVMGGLLISLLTAVGLAVYCWSEKDRLQEALNK